LFDGLKIMNAGEKYTCFQGQYPVIMLTLKSAKQPKWEMAYESIIDEISGEYKRHDYVLKCSELIEEDKEKYRAIRGRRAKDVDYAKALAFLSECLFQYHKKKAVILIDEYDVPLENSYYSGFYDKMIGFIRSLFESALKTNPYLEFSVITGCLRISKESVFTGLNNLKMISILSDDYDEYFGFVEGEVREMLRFYGREQKMDTMKEWYDGYQFGETEVYNPWSVINYTERLYTNENAFPTAAWSNTSSNSIVKDLIVRSSEETRSEIEALVKGEEIEKKVHEDITYDDIYASEDNLWNFLFFTGYLKKTNMRMDNINRYVTMAIPNKELLYIYENTIESWFRERVKMQNLDTLYQAMLHGDVENFQIELSRQLQFTISYMDSRESFYHGFLLGLFANLTQYLRKSNRESGLGRYDILVYSHDLSTVPVIIELKVVDKYRDLDAACEQALNQIREKEYSQDLAEEGYQEVIWYGMGFYKKQVRVHMERCSCLC
ncbi:MAG: AAA family ATPase, partial [Lachnospiraceae bacterium]|nr:AAA family ATPase [Lachnospiraceae bacterium]